MKSIENSAKYKSTGSKDPAPSFNISKIGIVSRDYRKKFGNDYRDYSYALADVLKRLDGARCDAALFSLFSITTRASYDVLAKINNLKLKNIKAVFLEEFVDRGGQNRKPGEYVIYHRTTSGWAEHRLEQWFGTITGMSAVKINEFVDDEIPTRLLGNSCVLLCGEINGVRYSRKDKKVIDVYRLKAAIPKRISIILNPTHDRMTRFEMKLKRQFLSKNGRWVISVWNKGRQDKNKVVKDGDKPAWTIFHGGKETTVERIPNEYGVEFGILDIKNAK